MIECYFYLDESVTDEAIGKQITTHIKKIKDDKTEDGGPTNEFIDLSEESRKHRIITKVTVPVTVQVCINIATGRIKQRHPRTDIKEVYDSVVVQIRITDVAESVTIGVALVSVYH